MHQVAAFLVFMFLVLFQPAVALSWTPIGEISAHELNIISQASRKSFSWVIKEAVAFDTRRGSVTILFKNGDIGIYGVSTSSVKSPEDADSPTDSTSLDPIIEFIGKWETKNDPDDLAEEKLAEADLTAEKVVQAAERKQALEKGDADNLGTLARRGNRYFALVFPLLTRLAPIYQIGILVEYLDSEYSRSEDKPDDNQKITAIRLIHTLASENQEAARRIYYMLSSTKREIRRLAPEIYKELISLEQTETQRQPFFGY